MGRPIFGGRPVFPEGPAGSSDLGLHYYDLSAGVGTQPRGMTVSVTGQGDDFYQIEATGTGSVTDGLNEGWARTFQAYDTDGEIVDLSAGGHWLMWELLLDAADFAVGDDLLAMFGPAQVSGGVPETLASFTGLDVGTLHGVTTGVGAGDRGRSSTTAASNATTVLDTVNRLRAWWIPQIDVGGATGEFGFASPQWLDAALAYLGVDAATNINTSNPDFTKPWGLALAVGFDAAHGNTKTLTCRIGARAYPMPAL